MNAPFKAAGLRDPFNAFVCDDELFVKPTDAGRLQGLKAGLMEVLDRAPQGPAGRRIVPVRASVRDVSDLEGEIGRKPVSSGSRAR